MKQCTTEISARVHIPAELYTAQHEERVQWLHNFWHENQRGQSVVVPGQELVVQTPAAHHADEI